MKLILALALNEENQLVNTHFGDCTYFHLFEWTETKFVSKGSIDNIYKSASEKNIHGNQEKGMKISLYLKENNVNTLVAKQFGKNIQLINQHFIPTIVGTNSISETLSILQHNIKWLMEELQSGKMEFKLFDLRKGCIKLKIINPKNKRASAVSSK